MTEETIHIQVEGPDEKVQHLEIPQGINLSLMEILKASEYNILATCGGMALCATCHIQILEGMEKLDERSDAELDMLDTLPDSDDESRLACQIKVTPEIDGLRIRLSNNQ